VLNRYAGTYELGPDFFVVMTIDEGRLMAKPGDEPKQPLYAEAEDHFFSKTFNAQVEFTKDKSGDVTGLILRKAGSEKRAPRRKPTTVQ
jgi:hypothetical protein